MNEGQLLVPANRAGPICPKSPSLFLLTSPGHDSNNCPSSLNKISSTSYWIFGHFFTEYSVYRFSWLKSTLISRWRCLLCAGDCLERMWLRELRTWQNSSPSPSWHASLTHHDVPNCKRVVNINRRNTVQFAISDQSTRLWALLWLN